MVFESVIVDILNKYLKPYVKKLDSSQLNLGVWKGDVRVEKLELKEDLFAEADLDIPIRIKRSYIGKLEAHIPWKHLTKEPIEITIDEVYVILGPDLDTQYDAKRALKRERKEKDKKIKEYHDALKKKKKKLKEAKKDKKKKKANKPDTFAEKLAVHMTKNLQVKVRDIHVRYEDDVTNRGSTIAAGLTLHSLCLKSTDANWVPCVVRESVTLIYKLIELNCLGVYWNTSGVSSFASPELSTAQMIEAMRSAIARPAVPPPPTNSYLLNPMSAAARLKLNLKPGVDLTLPQLVMGVECDDIVFSLQEAQMKTLMLTVESYDRHVVNQKYLEYKPRAASAKDDPRAWWRYAITSVLEVEVKRRTQMWSWKHMKKHRAVVKLYMEKYYEMDHAINPSSSLVQRVQELEDQLDWFNILVYREKAIKKDKYKPRKESASSGHKPLGKTVSSQSAGRHDPPPTTPGRQAGPSTTAKETQETKQGATPPKSSSPTHPAQQLSQAPGPVPSPGEARRVVESSRRKKSKDKGAEKKEGFFSRLKQRLKQPEKEGAAKPAVKGEESVMDSAAKEALVKGNERKAADKKTVSRKESKADKKELAKKEAAAAAMQASPEEEEKDREELYKAIGYSPDEDFVEYPKEYVAHEIHVVVNTLTLELLGRREKVGTLVTRKIKADVRNRPSSESVSVQASVGGLEMEGMTTTMITSRVGPSAKDRDDSLIDLQLEINPLDCPEMDVAVKAVLRPLQITYDFGTVNGLVEMFKPPNNIHFQELTNAASASWDQLKHQTTAGLQEALKNRKHVDLDITLHSPYLIVPEGGNFSEKAHLIVVDLGQLRVFGKTKAFKQLPKRMTTSEDLSNYYDKFSVSLAGMQVLVAKPGENWRRAMASGSSPMHIIHPTGFEIQLLKSIVNDDALLATMRVEGTISGFEVSVSDTQLETLIMVAATQALPPALVNTSKDYDQLPDYTPAKLLLDDATKLVELDTISLMSVSSFGDEDEEDEEECSISPSLTPVGSQVFLPTLDDNTDEEVSRNVFTDVSIKLLVEKVSLKLTQTNTKEKSVKKRASQSPLLDILIRDIQADVVDRKWDTQGSVAMREVAILDHITAETDGSPTYLLKTKPLDDGNFISARFVTVSGVGREFALKYTGLEDSLSARLSLVKLRLHRSTIKSLIDYSTTFIPTIDRIKPAGKEESEGLESIIEEDLPLAPAINRKDFEVDLKPITKDFGYDVQFEGIDVTLVQEHSDFLYAGLTGFSVKGSARPETISVLASIKDLAVRDVSLASSATDVISTADNDRGFILMNVVQHNLKANQRVLHDLSWVDTSLKAEVNRVNVSVNPVFMSNVLEFVKQLEFDKSAFKSAAKTTAETAAVTATAIMESTKSAHRLKLDLTLHAPVVELPFTTDTRQGSIYIDLGEFEIVNNLKHGHEMHHGSLDSDSPTETVRLMGAKTVLDCMEIRTTSIQITRKSCARTSECVVGDRSCSSYEESSTVILEPLEFNASIARNISGPTRAFPNVDISLSLKAIKLHVAEEDVNALISIGMSASRITEVMATPPKPKDVETRPRFTTTFSRPKRGTLAAIGRQRTRTRTSSRLGQFHSYEDVTEVRVAAKLDSVTFDLTTNDGPLLRAGASGLSTKIDVLKNKVLVSGSTTSLSVTDLTVPSGVYSKVVSIVEKGDPVSTLQITVYTEEGQNPLSPLGKLEANVAQIQLFLPVLFLLQTVTFVQRLDIDKKTLKTASKKAQGGATAVTSAAQDKYFAVKVKVAAPVLIIPTSQEATQGVMVDLGSLSVENTLLVPEENVGLDAFGITLNHFKISRVLLDPTVKTGLVVLAERALLQPFNLLLAVERNLCPWYTKVPTVRLNLNMEDLKIFLGSDDLKQFFTFGMSLADQVSTLLPDAGVVDPEASTTSTASLEAQSTPVESSVSDSEAEAFEFLRIFSSLDGIEIKLFKDEPQLSTTDEKSKDFSQMEEFALTSLELVTMVASVKMLSNQEVEVKASMKDIALCDKQKDHQDRVTGNRVIQHYTSNPLKAYTGQIDNPVVSVQYVLRDDQHIVLFTAENLLILSDVEFLKGMSDYFTAIFDPSATKKDTTKDQPKTDASDEQENQSKLVRQETVKEEKKKKATPLPKLKVNASIKNFRVALIENIDTPQPQALTLKLSTHFHVQLTELSKQATVNLADLSIATSSFFDLDTTTSWILLPCSISLSMSGPVDKPAMNIQAMVDPIFLTLSPAIVRLIIHAVQTLMPKQTEVVTPAPVDLWKKKLVSQSNLWFLAPTRLHKAVTDGGAEKSEDKGETLTVSMESVEVHLESEGVDSTPGHSVLALSVSAVLQLSEWTGDLSMTGDIQCEASYYNEALAVWEPILEPLELEQEKQRLWEINVKMDKKPPAVGDGEPQFSVELASVLPLQITLTKTSLQLIKTLVDAYTKDYGKQVQGNVKVDALTGAPFTFVNKLGKDVFLFLKPGPTLKLKGGENFFKLHYGDSVDVYRKKVVRRRSYASMLTQSKKEASMVDISVGTKFLNIMNVPVDNPGAFYYSLIPKPELSDSVSTYGMVVEVAVTGEKKTIIARSTVQFDNQLTVPIDILSVVPGHTPEPVLVSVIEANKMYSVPIEIATGSEFLVRPSGFGFTNQVPPLSWMKSKQGDKVNVKCELTPSDPAPYYLRVNRTEERYKIKRNLPRDEFAHHIFHVHPPIVLHNLLPFELYVDYPSKCIGPGQSECLHHVDLDKEQELSVMVVRKHGNSLQGKFTLKKEQSMYINFFVSDKDVSVELSVHVEDESYLKLGVFCPFWMVNKTDLTLVYKDGDKTTKHPPGNDIVLLSTGNKKNKIQLRAVTSNKSLTDPTKSFSLNAVGSSGNFSCKLGDQRYRFGVEIRLSQFTLSKLVIVTPYYLLVNETKFNLQVYEEDTPSNRTTLPPEEVISFWPLTSGQKLVAIVMDGDEACSAPFNYLRSDFTVLQFSKNKEAPALCLEVQESESATIVTFTPYYPGCVPVQIINHFPDVTLQFVQDTKSPLVIAHTLEPGEMVLYTWDDPSGRKMIKWSFPGVTKVTNCKPIDVNKDSEEEFKFKISGLPSTGSGFFQRKKATPTSPTPISPQEDTWLEITEDLSEQLVTSSQAGAEGSADRTSEESSLSSLSFQGADKGYWKSFIDGLQRVIIFTPEKEVVNRIQAENSYSVPLFEASLSLRSIGLSLVDNNKKRELAFIAITQSGIIWQIDKGKNKSIWKTVNTSLIEVLEAAYQAKKLDIKEKSLSVNLETMEMYSPVKGKLRRTHHDGVFVKFALSEKDYSVQAKIGYVQVDNQLPFSVYPQVLYPLPPPPTVASTTEPKPFVEASLIIRKNDQSSGLHFKYVHVLIQKMAVNVDLGFILSLVDFFSISGADPLFQTEYVENDVEYVSKSLKETVVPELAEDFNISRSFFDVLHLAPIKVTLSFNIRSVGQNKEDSEITTGDRFLELFLHSIGVILTSVQETEMKFSVFHLEYQPQTGRGLTHLLMKHYRNQLLFQLHTLIFGLDVLGNPVSVVRGVVEGAIDLFYEPIKGSVLGPEEFFEGLGLGLRSFFGAGVVGGITGASARITGAVGDVFAKLSFDNEFINKRQQQKAKPPKMGSKLGGFAKNLFEGVTGVVTQPVKGLQKEGAVGLLKGTGRGLVGLIIRPTGGLVDLASGTLDFVTRKTQIGNFEIEDIRPPRFIGRDGVITPFSPQKAIGTALLVGVDEGKFVETDYYSGHVKVSASPLKFVLVTDRRFMVIEKKVLTDGWNSTYQAVFMLMSKPVESKDVNILVSYADPKYKSKKLNLKLTSAQLAEDVAHVVNDSYLTYASNQ